jgi:TetR/AcrR family transcriptional regulator
MSSVTITAADKTLGKALGKTHEKAPEIATRMRSEDRRELILDAATAVFGERGQPYVVRMFGTMEALFLEVLERALDTLMKTFARALTDTSPLPAGLEDTPSLRIGRAYADLLVDRGLLLSLMQSFMLGADPVIGPVARAGFIRVYTFLRDEVGMTPLEADVFLAHGMMMNTMVGLRMADLYADGDPCAIDLLETALPGKLDVLLDSSKPA